MRLFLLGSRDLKGISEILDGIVVLRIRYGQALASRPHGGVLIQKLLEKLYKKAAKNLPSGMSCAIVVDAEVELEDLGLIRAVIGLWDMVTRNGGRVILVGYPMVTVSGRKTRMPPMLPDFGLARDIASGLKCEDNNRRWQEHMLAERSRQSEKTQLLPALVTAERLNFGYDIRGGNEHIRPLRIFDDGEKTYLQMPAEMKNREAPVLLIVGNDGKGEVTNYRVQRQTYIVDRLFDRANLVLGAGKKNKGLTVEISRSPKG
jgi:hypothetical protein